MAAPRTGDGIDSQFAGPGTLARVHVGCSDPHALKETGPELDVVHPLTRGSGGARHASHVLLPVVRLDDNVEERCGQRVSDPDDLELDAEETGGLVSVFD